MTEHSGLSVSHERAFYGVKHLEPRDGKDRGWWWWVKWPDGTGTASAAVTRGQAIVLAERTIADRGLTAVKESG
jgi:hypothetical protein